MRYVKLLLLSLFLTLLVAVPAHASGYDDHGVYYSDAEIIGAIYAEFGWSGDVALAVSQCESNLVPNITNPSGAKGIFQMMPGSAESVGYSYYDMDNPYIAAAAAADLYHLYGWTPWVCAY